MQEFRINTRKIIGSTMSLPPNCSGVSGSGQDTIFWFNNDDMTQPDMAAINAEWLTHKWGIIKVSEAVEANTYDVCISTEQAEITPTLNGVPTELLAVVDGVACFEVVSVDDFTVSTVELDNEEVTYVTS